MEWDKDYINISGIIKNNVKVTHADSVRLADFHERLVSLAWIAIGNHLFFWISYVQTMASKQ